MAKLFAGCSVDCKLDPKENEMEWIAGELRAVREEALKTICYQCSLKDSRTDGHMCPHKQQAFNAGLLRAAEIAESFEFKRLGEELAERIREEAGCE